MTLTPADLSGLSVEREATTVHDQAASRLVDIMLTIKFFEKMLMIIIIIVAVNHYNIIYYYYYYYIIYKNNIYL